MAETAKRVARTVWRLVRKVVKKPWEFTGPTSHPEYIEANQSTAEYRKFNPPGVKLSIPRTDPEKVFDIKYYTRDRRRPQAYKVDWEYDPNNPEHIQFMKEYLDKMPLPRFWVMGDIRGINDGYLEDGGYQVGGSKKKAALDAAAAAEAAARAAQASSPPPPEQKVPAAGGK